MTHSRWNPARFPAGFHHICAACPSSSSAMRLIVKIGAKSIGPISSLYLVLELSEHQISSGSEKSTYRA